MIVHGQPVESDPLIVQAGRVALSGDLTVPPAAGGVIVFAHGSGSGRMSPRNQVVASALVARGFATLLFDLLTREEELEDAYTRHLRFDIPLLANRLVGAIEWIGRHPRVGGLPVGLFGASTGAAAALIAATRVPNVAAVVSRGGRPDLAAGALWRVRCPTLLIVGGADTEVIELNHEAMQKMEAPTHLHIVPGAGHLFEEAGALRQVMDAAGAWFERFVLPQREHETHAYP